MANQFVDQGFEVLSQVLDRFRFGFHAAADNRYVPKKIEPRTSLLRQGLDQEQKAIYFIHEEEVSRTGAKVQKSFQRTRWYDGKVYNWLGIRKQAGKGEGGSGLAFDQIIPVEKKQFSFTVTLCYLYKFLFFA